MTIRLEDIPSVPFAVRAERALKLCEQDYAKTTMERLRDSMALLDISEGDFERWCREFGVTSR